jgi:hypothetical protein
MSPTGHDSMTFINGHCVTFFLLSNHPSIHPFLHFIIDVNEFLVFLGSCVHSLHVQMSIVLCLQTPLLSHPVQDYAKNSI